MLLVETKRKSRGIKQDGEIDKSAIYVRQANCVGNAIKSCAYECFARTNFYVARASASKNDDDRVIWQLREERKKR